MGDTAFVQVPFVGGIEQKAAAQYVNPETKQVDVINGQFTKVGAIDKRLGVQCLGLAPGVSLATWSRSALSVIGSVGTGQPALSAYSPSAKAWTNMGPVPGVMPWRRPVITQQGGFVPNLCDFPGPNGRVLRAIGFVDVTYNLFFQVIDADTGETYLPEVELFTNPHVTIDFPSFVQILYVPTAAAGKQVVILYCDGNSTTSNIWGLTYDPVANAVTAATNIIADCRSFNASVFNGDASGRILASYFTGSVTMTAAKFSTFVPGTWTLNNTVSLDTNVSQTLQGHIYVIGTFGASNNIWITWDLTNATNYLIRMSTFKADGTFTSVASAVNIVTMASPSTPAIPYGLASNNATLARFTYLLTSVGVNGNASQPVFLLLGPTNTAASPAYGAAGQVPITSPFFVNGNLYQGFVQTLGQAGGNNTSTTGNSTQGTVYLCQIAQGNLVTFARSIMLPVATVAPRQTDFWAFLVQPGFTFTRVPIVSSYSATRVAFGMKTNAQDRLATKDAFGGSYMVDFNWDQTLQYIANELGDGLHISTGVPMTSDGIGVYETGFFHYPEFSKAALASGGVLTANASYGYAVIYTYTDNNGLIHRSAPYFIASITTSTGNQEVQLTIPYYEMSYRHGPTGSTLPLGVFAEVYRTQPNGSTYNLIDRTLCPAVAGTTSTFQTFSDSTITDAQAATGAPIYTTGGVLDHVNPPAAWVQCLHKSRLWIVDETRRVVWFTKAFQPGEAPGFNEALTFQLPESGDITGMISMDDKLLIFKSDSIFVVYGDGPAATGQGSDLTAPQKIPTDTGATDWRSLVLSANGVQFAGARGIMQLDRGLNVTWLGRPVQDVFKNFSIIVDAARVPTVNHIRFVMWNQDGSFITLIYDDEVDSWARWTYATPPNQQPMSAVVVSGLHTFVTADGNVWQEKTAASSQPYEDTSADGVTPNFVPITITTAWLKTQGLQGYMRTRRIQPLADVMAPAGLSLKLAVNYDPTIVQSWSWTDLVAAPPTGPLIVDAHVAGAYNKSEAVQLTLTDMAPTLPNSGQGLRFIGLGVEMQNIGPRYLRLGANLRG